jgi:hypothetical protein
VDVNGSKDRVKDASPSDDGFSIELVAGALWLRPTSFPSSAAFGHPLSSARLSTAGGDPHRA